MTPFISSKLRSKVLSYFFTNPDSLLYVRELAVVIGEDPGNLSKELRKLEKEGIFISAAKGSIKLYSLDRKYPLFNELKKIVFKTTGIEGSLKQLVLKYAGIKIAMIYGSYAKERENKNSDIDILVVGDFSRGEFTRDIRTLESKLNREINFSSYTEEEFDKERKKKGGFLSMVMKDNIIMLKGSLYDR